MALNSMLNLQIYDILKKDILQQKLRPGMRLIDSQIAEKYGISRTPVRDALYMLINEGLVESKGKRGYYVLQVCAEDIDELYDIRIMLETQVLRMILERNMPADREACIAQLEEIRSHTAEIMAVGDWLGADEFFHDALVRLTGSRRMRGISEDIRNQTRVFRQLTSAFDARVKYAAELHERILDAMIAEDGVLAEQLLREHIESGRREALLDALSDTQNGEL